MHQQYGVPHMAKKLKKEKNRIPYSVWTNSQLSIVRHYGACIIDGKRYVLDYDNCPVVSSDGGEMKYFPDLVEA